MNRLPTKLDDCIQHDEESELFIVEGDSAARSVGAICCSATQAVLPMQGKPLNAIKANRKDIVAHPKYADVLNALGIDVNIERDAVDDEGFQVDLETLRYENVILLFDPDADGIHARTLMHWFFYKWLRPLLDSGRVFDAYPPLWQLSADGFDEPAFAFTKPHYDRLMQVLRERQIQPTTVRFQGLGNIPGKVLGQLCVDRDSRQTTPVSARDAENALKLFDEMRQLGN